VFKSSSSALPKEFQTNHSSDHHRKTIPSLLGDDVRTPDFSLASSKHDWLADNVQLRRSLLHDQTRSHKQVRATFIDIAKALHSVSHESMILATCQVGVPERWLMYTSSLCNGTVTCFLVGGSLLS